MKIILIFSVLAISTYAQDDGPYWVCIITLFQFVLTYTPS